MKMIILVSQTQSEIADCKSVVPVLRAAILDSFEINTAKLHNYCNFIKTLKKWYHLQLSFFMVESLFLKSDLRNPVG